MFDSLDNKRHLVSVCDYELLEALGSSVRVGDNLVIWCTIAILPFSILITRLIQIFPTADKLAKTKPLQCHDVSPCVFIISEVIRRLFQPKSRDLVGNAIDI